MFKRHASFHDKNFAADYVVLAGESGQQLAINSILILLSPFQGHIMTTCQFGKFRLHKSIITGISPISLDS